MSDKTFDVAMWSKLDIEGIMDNINVKYTEDKKDEFIDDVIAFLSSNFDANYGINWGVIEDAVYSIGEQYDWIK